MKYFIIFNARLRHFIPYPVKPHTVISPDP